VELDKGGGRTIGTDTDTFAEGGQRQTNTKETQRQIERG
jgi:hypothetical protein